jgi:PncC family amidohydrolase
MTGDPARDRIAGHGPPRVHRGQGGAPEVPEAVGPAPPGPDPVPPEATAEALWALAFELGPVLRSRGLTLAVAESLTGGWITAALTGVPGSSDYLLAGITAYSNQAKTMLLGVNPETLAGFGAVSSHCAREMARGIRRRIGADLGLSATGIAGPGGGSPLKPVGLVYLTVTDSSRFVTAERRIPGDRLAVTRRAAWEALALLKKFLGRLSA